MTYVRTITLRHGRGHGAPAELLRAALKAMSRAGWRERVGREFAGYLVSDSEAGCAGECDGGLRDRQEHQIFLQREALQ